jgi:hypothetical protein
MFCVECGVPNPDNARFCTACGKGVVRLTPSPRNSTEEVILQTFPSTESTFTPPQGNRTKWNILTVVVVVFLIGFIVSNIPKNINPSNNTDPTKNTSDNVTVEVMMASLDAKGYLSQGDVRVARYRTLLELLADKIGDELTGDNKQDKISSMFVAAQGLLEKRGISESLLNMMEGMNQVIHVGKIGLLSDNLAGYVMIRSNLSQTNEQAIATIRAMGPKVIHMLGTGQIRSDGIGGMIIESESGTYHLTPDMFQ